MKKIYLLAFIVISGILQSNNAVSQCIPTTPWAGYLTWTEPAIAPTPYTGFLCQGHDSIFTRPGWAYFDGDGYEIHLIAGSQVTVRTDSCSTTVPASITMIDSIGNIIAGAYAAAACPNSLNFTAPYTGTYFIGYDTDGDCTNAGTAAVGTSSVKLNNASSITNCNPLQPINDTICAAIPLTLATPVTGSTLYADLTDPRDADVIAAGFICSTQPNNTIWYSFTPPSNGNYDFNTTSPATGGLDAWIGVFSASSCTGTLTYVECLVGASPGGSFTDTEYLTGGQLYYFMMDGFSGSAGAFTLELVANTTGIDENATLASQVSVYPNPSKGLLNIANNLKSKDVTFTIFNSVGQNMYAAELNSNMTTQVDVSFLANGIYMIQFKSNDGIFTKKIAVQNQN